MCRIDVSPPEMIVTSVLWQRPVYCFTSFVRGPWNTSLLLCMKRVHYPADLQNESLFNICFTFILILPWVTT